MSDVEKYGLFALVFVVGVLGLILIYGGDDGLSGSDASPAPVVIRKPSEALVPAARSSGNGPPRPRQQRPRQQDRNRPQGQPQRARPMRSFKVESLVADKGPFEFSEPPVTYPGERSASPQLASTEGRVFHTIEAGETLEKVSQRVFGTKTRWREILTLNPGLDPRKLQVGDTIIVQGPAAAPERKPSGRAVAVGPRAVNRALERASSKPVNKTVAKASDDAARTYLVKKGDTLGAIAQRELGSVRQSEKLFQANKDLLKSPDKLKPGMKLRIP